MARWYISATVQNGAGGTRDLVGEKFERVTCTNYTSLVTTLIAARLALSNNVLPMLDVANRDGTTGTTFPHDGYTRAGGFLTWTNIYKPAAAIWPSDPRTRPTAEIIIATSGGATADGHTGSGATESLYTDGQTALQNLLADATGGGPYARLGSTPYRTLLSLFHSHVLDSTSLSYFAWDDFSPGAPTTSVLPASPAPGQAASAPISIALNWDIVTPVYPADGVGTVRLWAQLTRSGGPESLLNNAVVNASTETYDWVTAGGVLNAGTYNLIYEARYTDPTIGTNHGAVTTLTANSYIVLS